MKKKMKGRERETRSEGKRKGRLFRRKEEIRK